MQNIVVVSMLVKDQSYKSAKVEVIKRLNDWFDEQLSPEFPDGTLLHYTIIESEEFNRITVNGIVYHRAGAEQ